MTVGGILQDGWIMASRASLSQNRILFRRLRGSVANMIEVTCPQCGEVYHADAIHVGRCIRCTKCSSVLPILGARSTAVQTPPEANDVRPTQSRVKARSAPPNSRAGLRVGTIVFVAVAAAVVLLILWHTSSDKPAIPLPRAATDTSQTSSEAGGATQAPLVNSDSLPAVTEQPPRTASDVAPCDKQSSRSSLPNGSRIVPDVDTKGLGVLEVQNGTNEDAVLSLYDSDADETIREVYVQARHSVRMKGIPEGTYQLVYTAGLDWDGSEAIFRCDPDYAQFERGFAFTEKRDQEGIQYHSITVTLHPVVGGNTRTKRISRQEFLKNHRRAASLPR